jgi:SAM-dependent methyltransferase
MTSPEGAGGLLLPRPPKLNMPLTLKGRLVNSLNHETILKDLHSGMKYDEVGAKYNCSKGTVWRIASHYDRLKYKKSGLKDLSKSETGRRHGWACGRPMAKYRGAYPGGFLKRLDKLLGIQEEHKVLHLFSGSIKDRENEDTMDIQKENNPTFVADARGEFPMKDNQYDVLIVDPPYDMQTNNGVKIDYSDKLWKTEFIRPYAWVKEAVRVLKPGGYLCILHHLIYKTPESTRRAMTVSVTCGPNTRVRGLSIFEKLEQKMGGLIASLNDHNIGDTEHGTT